MAKKILKKRGPKIGVKRGPYEKTVTKKESNKMIISEIDMDGIIDKVIKNESVINDNTGGEQLPENLNIVEEKIQDEIKPDNIVIKTDEEKFTEFLDSFPKEDQTKINESKEKIDSQAEENNSSSEESENEENEERVKRKYTKRKKDNSVEQDEQDIRDNAAMFFNGSLLLSLMDFLFPSAIKFVYTRFLKNKSAEKITHSQLVMTPDQIESLGDIPDKVSRIIFAKVNPIVLFFIFYSVMSFMNFRMALDEQEKLDKANAKG